MDSGLGAFAPPPMRNCAWGMTGAIARIPEGHGAGLVATIALTILTRAIIALVQSQELTEIDTAINDIAVSLKTGTRLRWSGTGRKGFNDRGL